MKSPSARRWRSGGPSRRACQKVIRSMDVKRFGLGLDRNDKWLAAVRAVERAKKAGVRDRRHDLGPRDGRANEPWPADGGRAADRVAHRDRQAGAQAGGAEPGAALLRPLRVEDGLERRAGARAHEDRPVLPRPDRAARRVRGHAVLVRHARRGSAEVLFEAKRLGTPMRSSRTSTWGGSTRETILKVRRHRESLGVTPVFKCVDTCAAEFEAITPYYYSTYQPGLDGARRAGNTVERPAREDEIGGDPAKEKVDHPGRRAQPHRAGDRVRLLLRARGLRGASWASSR
jgi:carbamoyl-phosphate synthase large subunit